MTFVIGNIYRKYIYANDINDFGFADMHTNIATVIVSFFLFMAYSKTLLFIDGVKIIRSATLGFII